MATDFETEFLIRLAPIWLACRWRIMGHPLMGHWPKPDLAFDLLGMVDYANEMRLCAESCMKLHGCAASEPSQKIAA